MICKRSYLHNRYILTNETLDVKFNMPVAIDAIDTRYKIHELNGRV